MTIYKVCQDENYGNATTMIFATMIEAEIYLSRLRKVLWGVEEGVFDGLEVFAIEPSTNEELEMELAREAAYTYMRNSRD